MLLQLYATVRARWFGPGDSIRLGCASQDLDNTLDRLVTELVGACVVQYMLAIVHFGA